MQRRAFAIRSIVSPEHFLGLSGGGAGLGPPPHELERACESGEFEFLVSTARLDWLPAATIPKEVWRSSGGLNLYRCSDRPGA